MKKHLVIIDMIRGFCQTGALADPTIQGIAPGIKALADSFLAAGDQVIFVNDAHPERAREFESFPVHCQVGTAEAEIIDVLAPLATSANVFKKNSTNAFHAPEFRTFVNNHQADMFYLVGCCSDICVLNLALTLNSYFNEGNLAGRVVVIADLCATYNAPGHDSATFHKLALALLGANQIEVITTQEVK